MNETQKDETLEFSMKKVVCVTIIGIVAFVLSQLLYVFLEEHLSIISWVALLVGGGICMWMLLEISEIAEIKKVNLLDGAKIEFIIMVAFWLPTYIVKKSDISYGMAFDRLIFAFLVPFSIAIITLIRKLSVTAYLLVAFQLSMLVLLMYSFGMVSAIIVSLYLIARYLEYKIDQEDKMSDEEKLERIRREEEFYKELKHMEELKKWSDKW